MELVLEVPLVVGAIEEVVGQRRELDREQHLWPSKVQAPAHVIHPDAVHMAQAHVAHHEYKHQHMGLATNGWHGAAQEQDAIAVQ